MKVAGATDRNLGVHGDPGLRATEAGSQSVHSGLARLDALLMSRRPGQPQARGFHKLLTAA